MNCFLCGDTVDKYRYPGTPELCYSCRVKRWKLLCQPIETMILCFDRNRNCKCDDSDYDDYDDGAPYLWTLHLRDTINR